MLNTHRYGNITEAAIPLFLWDFKHEINKGDLIVLAAFGGVYLGRHVGEVGVLILKLQLPYPG